MRPRPGQPCARGRCGSRPGRGVRSRAGVPRSGSRRRPWPTAEGSGGRSAVWRARRMSFCISSTSNQACSGSSRSSGILALSIGEPIGLALMTSAATSGSTPARSASSSPSLKASVCTARLMLIASLRISPWPFGPTWVTVWPSSRSSGSTAANACRSPPTMIASVPLSAWGMLPETGASSIWAPRARTRSASRRLACGLTVLMSTYTCPGCQAGEQALRPGADRFERGIVGDHAEHDVGSKLPPRAACSSRSGRARAAARPWPRCGWCRTQGDRRRAGDRRCGCPSRRAR